MIFVENAWNNEFSPWAFSESSICFIVNIFHRVCFQSTDEAFLYGLCQFRSLQINSTSPKRIFAALHLDNKKFDDKNVGAYHMAAFEIALLIELTIAEKRRRYWQIAPTNNVLPS